MGVGCFESMHIQVSSDSLECWIHLDRIISTHLLCYIMICLFFDLQVQEGDMKWQLI